MSGPLSHFQPEFPGEFVDRAREIVRCQTAEKRLWQRARLVLLLDENPQRNHVDVGREVGLSDQAVRKWRKRWCQGEFSLEDKPRPGRPAVFSPGRHCRGRSRADHWAEFKGGSDILSCGRRHAVWQFVAAAGRQNAVELSPISGCQFRPIRPDSGR